MYLSYSIILSMILLTHILLGALIGLKIKSFWLAIFLAFLSHYFLDMLPHNEYPIENIENNQWQKSLPDFLKVAADFGLGILIIFLLPDNSLKIYACGVVAIIPDGLSLLNQIFKNKFLEAHTYFHHQKVHLFRDKKISDFWRFLIQAIVIVSLIILLKP